MTSELYSREYYEKYASGLDIEYERNDHWLGFFRGVADQIVQRLRPTTVLDAGCAIGLLVETLREAGVDAEGVDFSEYAISKAPPAVTDHVRVADLTQPIDGRYDLVTCIEVIEHIPAADVGVALRNLTDITDQLLLSTTPRHHEEPTHINVQPPEYWSGLLADLGFHRDHGFDGRFLTPWATLYRRRDVSLSNVVRDFEHDRWTLVQERDALREELLRLTRAGSGKAEDQSSEVQRLRDEVRLAVDAAHGADAMRATAEGRLRHVEFALDAHKAREEETGELIERLYDLAGGDARRLDTMLNARTYQLYWKLLTPYRWLRGER